VDNDNDRARYIQTLQSLGFERHVDAICLQEVHGVASDIEHSLKAAFPGWAVLASHCLDADGLPYSAAGGVAILLSPRLAGMATVDFCELVPGRCMATTCRLGDNKFNLINIHNATLTQSGLRRILEFLESSRSFDSCYPMNSDCLLVGDLNFMASGDRRFQAGRPIAASLRVPVTTSATLQNLWMQELKHWTEIVQPFPINYSASGNSCARIDRAFCTIPTAHLINMNVTSAVIGTPEDYEAKCISYHAPLDIVFGSLTPRTTGSFSVPRYICRNPKFGELVETYASDIDILELPPSRQLPLLKSIFIEASRVVRDYLVTHDSSGVESQRLVAASVARAAWRNDARLARRLIGSSTLAASFLGVSGNTVYLLDPNAFDLFFNETRITQKQEVLAKLQKEKLATNSINAKKQLKSQMQGVRRMMALFWPSGKRLKLAGIRQSDGTTFCSPQDMQQALRDYWGPVYASKPFDAEAAKNFLKVYCNHNRHLFDFKDLELPNADDYFATLGRLRDSASGPDGLP